MAVLVRHLALTVDDDPIILAGVKGTLEDAGFQTFGVTSGDAAVLILAGWVRQIALLSSDVDMPGSRNGCALARHVAEQYPWIEIVIASGRRIPDLGDLPRKAAFIMKPFTVQWIRSHLEATFPASEIVMSTPPETRRRSMARSGIAI